MRAGEAFALLAASLWGINYVVVKVVLATVPEPVFLIIRFVATLALLAAYLVWKGEGVAVARRHIPAVALLGICGVGLQNISWTYGIHLTTASSAALLICTAPLFTLLYATATGREKAGWRRLAGTAAAFAGIYVIVVTTPGARLDFGSQAFVGNLLILASAVLFAYYSLACQHLLEHYSATKLFALASVVALPLFVVNGLTTAVAVDDFLVGGRTGGLFVYIVVFGTVTAFVCWFQGIRHSSPVRTALYQYMTPVVSTLLGSVVLGEEITLGYAAGAALIFAGLLAARLDRVGGAASNKAV